MTEHEVRTWMMCQYLMKVPQREFTNSVGKVFFILISKGLINNIIESLYALLGISGYESETRRITDNPML